MGRIVFCQIARSHKKGFSKCTCLCDHFAADTKANEAGDHLYERIAKTIVLLKNNPRDTQSYHVMLAIKYSDVAGKQGSGHKQFILLETCGPEVPAPRKDVKMVCQSNEAELDFGPD